MTKDEREIFVIGEYQYFAKADKQVKRMTRWISWINTEKHGM